MNHPGVDLPQIVDALDLGLIGIDSDRRIVLWNTWLAAASRVSSASVLGRTLDQVFPQASLRRLNSAITDALEMGASSLITHKLHPAILPLTTRAGRDLVCDLSVRPIGQMPRLSCIVQIVDVTIAADRERVLRERQTARYAAIVDNAPDVILTIDADGLIQMANPAAGREFGHSREELIGRPVSSLFEHSETWSTIWSKVSKGEILARPVEVVGRRKNGSLSYQEVSASRWFSDTHAFVTIILRDTNERHEAEEALKRLNETLEERVVSAIAERKVLADIVDNTDAFIQVLDLDYNVLAINKASAAEFRRVWGRAPKIGDNFLELLASMPSERDKARELWGRALAGEVFTTVQAFGEADLDRRHYELKFNSLRDARGRQIAAFQFVYDVTERLEHQAQLVKIEEALRQSQKMEAIGQLTGGIAHDFNNLLTGIMGAMDVLKRRVAAGKYEDMHRFMDAAVASASRAAALTHRLLAFARRQPLDPKPLDPNQLIVGMQDLLTRTVGEQIRLNVDLAQDLWPAETDANQLENALLNLVINARDAMPDGGEIAVQTGNRTFASPANYAFGRFEAGDYSVIRVIDNGSGMAPDVIDKVFDPFFTTKPIGQGTGLGLSMIYGFAKQSNGHVDIESAVGEGTTVSLFLPRSRSAMGDEVDREVTIAPAGSGEAVLIVEDEPSVRLLIAEVLRELGYDCLEASDGNAALPILSSNVNLDLLITDVGLPGLNGRQLAEIARQHRPGLKILFVTGYAQHAAGSAPFLGPGMQMVKKPFALDDLAVKIHEMLGPRRTKDAGTPSG